MRWMSPTSAIFSRDPPLMLRRRGTTYGGTKVRHALPSESQAHGPIQGVISPRDVERSKKSKPREFDDSHGGQGSVRENGTLKKL